MWDEQCPVSHSVPAFCSGGQKHQSPFRRHRPWHVYRQKLGRHNGRHHWGWQPNRTRHNHHRTLANDQSTTRYDGASSGLYRRQTSSAMVKHMASHSGWVWKQASRARAGTTLLQRVSRFNFAEAKRWSDNANPLSTDSRIPVGRTRVSRRWWCDQPTIVQASIWKAGSQLPACCKWLRSDWSARTSTKRQHTGAL